MEGLKVVVRTENDGKGEVYAINVNDTRTNQSWSVNKRLEDVHALYSALSKTSDSVPLPPGYSRIGYLTRFFQSELPEMQGYLDSILVDPCFLSNQEVFSFLGAYENLPSSRLLRVCGVDEKETRFTVRFIESGENIVLTAEVDLNVIHRFEQYMQTIGYAGSTISVIKCYGDFGVWELTLTETITCFKYNQKLTILCIGLDDGQIMFLRIKTEKNSQEYEKYGKVAVHSAPVCGIASDYTNSKVYSVCLNGQLVITSLVDQEMFVSFNLMNKPSNLLLSADLRTIFLPVKREVIKFDIESETEKKAFVVDFSGFISSTCLSSNGYCIVGGFDGEINVFNSDSLLIQKYSVFTAVNCIVYNEKWRLIVIADKKGNLSLWNNQGDSIIKWKAHSNSTAVCFNEKRLTSAGTEKLLKNWSFEGIPNH